MTIDFKIIGVEELAMRLENFASKSSEGARFAMRDGARDVAELAKKFAPVDLGNLEDSIKVRSQRDGVRGRYTYEVYVDETHEAEGKVVGDYASYMHEGYIDGKPYKLGPGSLEKQAELGVEVGPKFLDRAKDELEASIKQSVADGIAKRIGK